MHRTFSLSLAEKNQKILNNLVNSYGVLLERVKMTNQVASHSTNVVIKT